MTQLHVSGIDENQMDNARIRSYQIRHSTNYVFII